MIARRRRSAAPLSRLFKFWRGPARYTTGRHNAHARCAACSGDAICLRCGGRGRVLVVPMGWQRRPSLEQCPECLGAAACPACTTDPEN